MTASEALLAALIIIFSVPWLVWRVFRLEAVAPLAVVQIIAGVVLGPGVLGIAAPSFHAAVFTPSTIMALSGIANWAVMIFVFFAGCELELDAVWSGRRDALTTAGLALVTPLLFGIVAALLLLQLGDNWAGPRGAPWQVVVGTGMACAVTALPILVLLLQQLELLRTPLGQRILRYASLDDLAIWGVLALVLLDVHRLALQASFLLVFAVACFIYLRIMKAAREQERWGIALLWLLISAFASDYCGLHFMVGAFLAGAVTQRHWFDLQRFDLFREMVLLSLMPIFFLATGLRTSWHMGGYVIFAAAAVLLVASVAGKLAGVALAARLLKWPEGDVRVIGWLLQTKALIMIIFANVLLDREIISADLFTALLLMAVASTALTIPVVRPNLATLNKCVQD